MPRLLHSYGSARVYEAGVSRARAGQRFHVVAPNVSLFVAKITTARKIAQLASDYAAR